MRKFITIFFILLFFGLLVNAIISENRVVALTVILRDKTDAQITEITNELQKVATKYGLKVNEVPLGKLVEEKMKSLK